MKKMLDLCAGFGGQSEAFLRAGWEVLRMDNNPLLSEVENMAIGDVYDESNDDLWLQDIHVEYVHAGPTCREFSLAFNAPRSQAIHTGTGDDYYPTEGVKLVKRCKQIIDYINPSFWSIENVRGSIKYLTPILGEPRLIVGPYVYWGNFPLFEIDASTLPNKAQLDKRHSPLRSNHRAHCPLVLSQAFFDAMECQKSILEY